MYSFTRYETYVIATLLLVIATNIGVRAYVFHRLPDVTIVPAAAVASAATKEQDAGSDPPSPPEREQQESTVESEDLSAPQQEKIDLNRAGFDELLTLPGIGPTLAERILDYRRRVGRFADVHQLLNVSGIGQKRLESLLPLVEVGEGDE